MRSTLPAALLGALALPAQEATDPAPAPAAVTVFESGAGGYHTYRIPALCVARSGALLAFCEGRKGGRGDSGDIDLLVRRSTDGGRTWGAAQVVWDDGANTCGNPCPVVDRETGAIWLLLTRNLGGDREPQIIAGASQGTRTVWVCHSRDDGVSWSRPVDISASTKRADWTWYATGPGVGIQLRAGEHAGRLVVPCDHIEADTRHYYSHVIWSDDHGATWQLGGRAPRHGVNECQVVELADGRLLLNMRNYDRSKRARQVCVSVDGGASWREQRHDPALIEPICQAGMAYVPAAEAGAPGLVLFSNPASAKARVRMTLRGSRDEGETWSGGLVLHEGPAAYSCLAVLGEGAVGCLFECGVTHAYERIAFRSVAIDAALR